MTRRDERGLLWDIVSHGRLAMEFVGESPLRQYVSDVRCQSAVERQLIIVGEAAGQLARLDEETARRLSEPVHQVVGLRNILVHGYDIVAHEKVFEVIREQLPALISSAEEILLELGGAPPPTE